MPVVNEHQIADSNRAGSSRNDAQFTNRFSKSYKMSRKSDAMSPELIWSIPDMFLCLESLGASVPKDSAPYDRISYSESSFDRVSQLNLIFLANFKENYLFGIHSLYRRCHWTLETALYTGMERS